MIDIARLKNVASSAYPQHRGSRAVHSRYGFLIPESRPKSVTRFDSTTNPRASHGGSSVSSTHTSASVSKPDIAEFK